MKKPLYHYLYDYTSAPRTFASDLRNHGFVASIGAISLLFLNLTSSPAYVHVDHAMTVFLMLLFAGGVSAAFTAIRNIYTSDAPTMYDVTVGNAVGYFILFGIAGLFLTGLASWTLLPAIAKKSLWIRVFASMALLYPWLWTAFVLRQKAGRSPSSSARHRRVEQAITIVVSLVPRVAAAVVLAIAFRFLPVSRYLIWALLAAWTIVITAIVVQGVACAWRQGRDGEC